MAFLQDTSALSLASCGLSELCLPEDVGPLAHQLARLDASRNGLTSLHHARALFVTLAPGLRSLALARNRLVDAGGLSALHSLRVLNLARNQLRDVDALQGMSALQELDVHHNQLTSLAGVSGLAQLADINASANQLAALPDLAGLTGLTQLNLRRNRLTSLVGEAAGTAWPARARHGAAGPRDPVQQQQEQQQCLLLPPSLRRLSLAANRLDLGQLAALRQLPRLADLCMDSSPFADALAQQRGAAPPGGANNSGGGAAAQGGRASPGPPGEAAYRRAVLATACTPSLLMLDGHPVTPGERVLLLTSALALTARQEAAADERADGLAPAKTVGPQLRGLQLHVTQLAARRAEQPEPDCSSSPDVAAGAQAQADPLAGVLPAMASPPPQEQQQPGKPGRMCYQGSLRGAAIACGVDMPPSPPGAGTGAPGSGEPLRIAAGAPPTAEAAEAAAAEAAAAAAAAVEASGEEGVFGLFISDQELQQRYLRAFRVNLADRRQRGADAAAVGCSGPPATPGAELSGGRCMLMGGEALAALQREEGAAVSDLTLAHMAHTEVLAALPLMAGLRRLRRLTLASVDGLATLPQLHPLLRLTRLQHLSVLDGSPLASLVLLRPYVAFRFAGLLSFNGTPLSAQEVAAASGLFGALEASLALALDQPLQQAALAACGVALLPGGTIAALPGKPAADAAAGAAAAAALDGQGAREASSRVRQVLAQLRAPGPALTLPAAALDAGSRSAAQLLDEAGRVQQQLVELQEVTWPALIEASMQEAFTGKQQQQGLAACSAG